MGAAQGFSISEPHGELTSLEKLGLRVSAMINSPLAQFGRKVLIHQLDTDSDQDWRAIMELLTEADGLEMTLCDDGSVILQWGALTDDVQVIASSVELKVVRQEAEEAPF